MPNIATILKEEISRLARKEIRAEIERLRKAGAQYRSDIAELKRRVAALEKQSAPRDGTATPKEAPSADNEQAGRTRFSAKGFASQRQKWGLSAAEMGSLVGVSAQTIYNWEAEKSRPRPTQLAAVTAIRGIGKRQAKARLEALAGQ